MKIKNIKRWTMTLATSLLLAGGLAGCGNASTMTQSNSSMTNSTNASTSKTSQPSNNTDLANLNYQSGQSAYINVNNGKSTLKPQTVTTPYVTYTNLDQLNRTSGGNTAYLNAKNVANDSLRVTQTVKPTGWHQKFVHNEAIINRGHEIAYSLSKGIDLDGKYNPQGQSGDQNNLKNLFTQTAFSNQKVQTIFETKVRNVLRDGKSVVYQVKPIFRGNELMARGVQLQAISNDGSLNFNVYLFNVQPGIQFNYNDGTSTIDAAMNVPTPAGAPTFNDHGQSRRSQYRYHHHAASMVGGWAIHHALRHHFSHHRF